MSHHGEDKPHPPIQPDPNNPSPLPPAPQPTPATEPIEGETE